LSDEKDTAGRASHIFSSLLMLLAIIFVLSYLRFFLNSLNAEKIKGKILIVISGVIVVRVILLISGIPDSHFYLFDPYLYATPFSPTLGDLAINTIVFTFLAYIIYKHVKIPEKLLATQFNRNAWIGILNALFIAFLIYAYSQSKGIITHSSINTIPANISEITFPVILIYLIFAANYLSVFLVGIFAFRTLSGEKKYKLIINYVSFFLVVIVIGFLFQFNIDTYTIIFGLLLYPLIGLTNNQIKQNAFFSSLVIFLLLFSAYILVFTVKFTSEKEKQKSKSFAISLSNEHDPIAEYLLEDISEKIVADTDMIRMFFREKFDGVKLYKHISDKYFSGYLKKYNTRITVCTPVDSILLENPDFTWIPCYPYFESYTNDFGIQIPTTSFYYIDNFTGLINYLGWIKYTEPGNAEISLFIEMESKLTTSSLGYPELLLDAQLQNINGDFEKSYAKYHKGHLVSQMGKYDYSLRSNNFEKETDEEFYTIKRNNYNHLVYKPDKQSTIVVSEKAVSALDMIVLFSYIFIFYYLILLIAIFLLVSHYRQMSFRDNLRNKIQFMVISVLLVSLVLIAGSTTWFNIRKYNQTQTRNIKEKIQSVYVELDHKLSFEQNLTKNWTSEKYESLSQLLIKFSDVFYTDINLYDPKGDLLATSRPEIFNLGLQNEKIDPVAYFNLHEEQLAKFIHRENINKLSYLSAYVPFVNAEGKLLAYLNLPYFTKQKELQDDITTITVAIINIYVLLILLTIIVVVVIADQITKPLELIQARFRGLALGGKYEKIKYSRQDEIGKLVGEYNNMVVELERSVELLARSERESAWREMAKQVAHEIKNPLTPMRLSVQQLKRAWDDKKENFDGYLQRVTDLLIEQIDNLSAIASEFSNFAKMPDAKIETVELSPVLAKAVSLFDNENVKINTSLCEEKLFVKADSEQLSRVFINIIKNGIQAIPDEDEGIINIKLIRKKSDAIIEISDNGKGIPEEIKPKMFSPNFTTKTSGMGLGLAIVKNILEQIGSKIEFDTKIGVGTTFKLYIPIAEIK
jgi:signal transduction histidine kinase